MENRNKILLAVALASFFTGGVLIGYAWGHSTVTVNIGNGSTTFNRGELIKQQEEILRKGEERQAAIQKEYDDLMAKLEADSRAKQQELDKEAEELRKRRNDNFQQLGKQLMQ